MSFLSAWWIYFGKYDMIYFTFFIFLWSTFRSDEYNNSLLWNSLLSPVWKTVMSYSATVSIVCFVLAWNSLGEPGKTQKHNKDEKLFCLYLSLSFFSSFSLSLFFFYNFLTFEIHIFDIHCISVFKYEAWSYLNVW